MSRNLGRIRAGVTPANPTTLADVVNAFENKSTMDKYGKTDNGKPFYRGTVIEMDFGFSVFASENIIEKLPEFESKQFFMDGTFRVVPNGCFGQLVVIHAEYKGHVRQSYCMIIDDTFFLQILIQDHLNDHL